MQRNYFLEARIKVGTGPGSRSVGAGHRTGQALAANSPQSVVQSYLEGVQTGVWQLTRALEAVQGTREALSQARHLLQGLSQTSQTLAPLREHVVQHKQLQVLTQLLPRLQAGEYGGWGWGSLGLASKSPQILTLSSSWVTREVITWRDAPGTSQRVILNFKEYLK